MTSENVRSEDVSSEPGTNEPSPLGRYDEPSAGDATGAEAQLFEVRLLGVPVDLYAEGRQHHDDLLQELSVLAVSTEESGRRLRPDLTELVDALGRRYGTPTSRPDAPVDEAVSRGDRTVDLAFTVPAHVLDATDRLESLLAKADELCRSGELLTMPRSAGMLRFSRWYLGEFRRQIAGQPPCPWPGPDELYRAEPGQPR